MSFGHEKHEHTSLIMDTEGGEEAISLFSIFGYEMCLNTKYVTFKHVQSTFKYNFYAVQEILSCFLDKKINY